MLTTEVENYPGFDHGVMGPEMMAKFQKQAERFGTRIGGEDIVRCDFSKKPFTLHTSGGKQGAGDGGHSRDRGDGQLDRAGE
jgi:thioredoxin reductase (NADPH)